MRSHLKGLNWLQRSIANHGDRLLLDAQPLLYLGLSTAIRLLTGLAIFKFLAAQFGPSDFGLLTQVMGGAAIFYMFAGGGISNGLIRNLSAATDDEQRRGWLSAALAINVLASAVLAIIALTFALVFGGGLLGHPTFGFAFVGIAFAQTIVAIGNLLLAYFSGVGRYKTIAVIQSLANLLWLALTLTLAEGMGFTGAILAVVLGPATSGLVALWMILRESRSEFTLRLEWNWPRLKTLLSYGAATACAVTSMPLAQLVIRLDMGARLGWDTVGYWQATVKLSDAYMLFIGTVFINYLLPQLSSRQSTAESTAFLLRFGASTLAIFILAGAALYLIRDEVIVLVYNLHFQPAANFILPQLVADTLKVAALLPHYYFLSRGRVLVVFMSELMQGLSAYLFYLAFSPSSGALAPIYAQVATYTALLIAMLWLRHFDAVARRRL